MLEVDVETTGLQPRHHKLFSVQFYDGENVLTIRTDEHPNERVQKCLDRAVAHGGLRAWNSKFDFGFLYLNGYTLPPDEYLHDGMLMAHIIDEQTSAALKVRGEKLFGKDERDYEHQVKEWLATERRRRRKESKETGEEYTPPTYRDVPEEIMGPYGEQDVILQRKVCEVYEKAVEMSDLQRVYDLERATMVALFWAEIRGVPVDREAAAKLEASLLASRDAKERQMKDLAGIDTFNANAPAQIAEALERRGVDLSGVPETKTGARQMSAEVLEGIDDPLAEAVLKWKSDNKLLTTYLGPMLHGKKDSTWGDQAPFIADDGRIHPNFRQLGAVTGRMSSADPNLQNWPRDDLRLRYLVRAEPGHKLVCCDLDAIEMRLFAAFAGNGAMLEQVREPDGDPHAYTAYHVGIEDRRRGDVVTPARQQAKVFNFQMIYGGGLRTIQQFFGVSRSRASEMLDRYHEAYPEISQFQQRIRAKLEDQGYVKTPWGRRHRVDDRKPVYEQAYKFPNKLIQGTAADLLKDAIVKIHAEGIEFILPVHDEIIAHVPEDDAERVARLIEQHMTDHPQLTAIVPITAEAQIVDRWSDAKEPGYVPDYAKED